MPSIAKRLTIVAIIVLLSFMLVAAFALQEVSRQRAQQAQFNQMQSVMYGLLNASEVDDTGQLIIMPQLLPDNRLNREESGLLASIYDQAGNLVWQSNSTLQRAAKHMPGQIGEWTFQRENDGQHAFLLGFTAAWELYEEEISYVYTLEESGTSFEEQQRNFQRYLFITLFSLSAVLIALLIGLLHWGLSPLRKMETELAALEQGEQSALEQHYPRELQGITRGMNALLNSERQRQTRYQHALDDLAHSLKTPLAVMRNLGEQNQLPPEVRQQLREQTERMDEIVLYQLNRASAQGQQLFRGQTAIKPVAERLMATLQKVYRDKALDITLTLHANDKVRLDEGDLLELMGNLLDNACKYAISAIHIGYQSTQAERIITIEDDGEGFPDELASRLLNRGTRADTAWEGQGIGLAASHHIAQASGGRLSLGESRELGGAAIHVHLPRF